MFEQKIKFLNINLNALNERCTFSSGDLLTGNISFELSKETTVTSITMAVKGKAHVHWSSGSGRNRRNYTANLDFFKLQGVIVRGNSAAGGTKLQAGTHVYPFTCQLPQGDFPTSFHGVHGQIVYTLTVSIHRPWHLSKDIVTELSFLNRIDINQPVLSAPLSGRNSMTVCFLWCASGPITVTASSEKKAFTPGETAKIICDFSNASSRLATPKLKLKQKQGFYTHNRVSRRIYFKTLNSSIGQPISPHTTDVHTEFMLTIPSSASLTISNCDILEVEYFIEVSLKVSYSFEVTVMIPIILCDTPVDPQPPQYSSINVCI
ncbi:arrestin domain-containing protein 3-like [Acanthopagrus latus]|uniref:arrestin domain-containing protein 3-like n=1 Tax=Acanthopagrus latus TaxID=8177 RepID=UPI00187CD0AA|nr:arrestin domain-containing protein 3-like [Acanthopagrus latus]